jgi:Barrel-sandwich domain of CusB or HlyD membrane-fusion
VRVPEIPGRTFSGKVTRIAKALETNTRTLPTEIDISNPDDALQPGVYCIVELNIPVITVEGPHAARCACSVGTAKIRKGQKWSILQLLV